MIDMMSLAILVGAGLIAISVLTSLISFRVGAPLLLVFLGVGLLAGEDGIGGIDFDNAGLAYFVGSIALAIILFDSGFETRWQTVKAAAWPSLTLATVGVVLTTGLVGAVAHVAFGMPLLESLLMGAIVSSTDAAAVFFLLRVGGINIRERVRSVLEIESGSNDPMAIFLTITLVELIAGGGSAQSLSWEVAGSFLLQMGIGALGGLAGGWLIVQAVNRIDLEQGLYPIIVISLALCLFAGVSMLGGSGFLAVYVGGMFAGNSRLHGARSLRRFQSGMTWLCQITMFLMLGLLATPSEFLDIAPQAIALALFLILVGRPLAIWLCLMPFGFTRSETAFIAWVGLRGAVSILLAILPLIAGFPDGQIFFNTAFIIVLVSLLVQGWTIKPMARRLGLIVPPRIGPVDRVELELPGGASHELVAYRTVAGSPVTLGERIPRWARPSLIVRNGQSMRLHKAGRVETGDLVLIFTSPDRLPLLDRLFASPTELKVEDREFYGDFTLAPDAAIGQLAATYGFPTPPQDADLTVCDVLKREFRGRVETGDRLAYGPVELIVRVAADDKIDEIGLSLEPSRSGRAGLFRRSGRT
ncbi:potassium/proton antiporter [Skermanella pratensis]|uniref:potassium/proton antiporter n=1 Tax=Skermanella pratensis TaxID=2233999 RepID=UPI001300D894|nr:potassium/proton antiporter [Skermanella pratensis]